MFIKGSRIIHIKYIFNLNVRYLNVIHIHQKGNFKIKLSVYKRFTNVNDLKQLSEQQSEYLSCFNTSFKISFILSDMSVNVLCIN